MNLAMKPGIRDGKGNFRLSVYETSRTYRGYSQKSPSHLSTWYALHLHDERLHEVCLPGGQILPIDGSPSKLLQNTTRNFLHNTNTVPIVLFQETISIKYCECTKQTVMWDK